MSYKLNLVHVRWTLVTCGLKSSWSLEPAAETQKANSCHAKSHSIFSTLDLTTSYYSLVFLYSPTLSLKACCTAAQAPADSVTKHGVQLQESDFDYNLEKFVFTRTAGSSAHLCAKFFIGYHRNKTPVLSTSIPPCAVVFQNINSEMRCKFEALSKLNYELHLSYQPSKFILQQIQ